MAQSKLVRRRRTRIPLACGVALLKLLPVALWCYMLVLVLESINYDPHQTRAALFGSLLDHYEISSLVASSGLYLLSLSDATSNCTQHTGCNQSAPTQTQWKTANLSTHSDWVVFYHIYIPRDDKAGREIALNIVQEQIQQLGRSYAGQQHRPYFTTSVHYTTIGDALNDTWMQGLCDKNYLQCQGRHFESGHEMLTLDQIPGYCSLNLHQKVLYLHTKGSFHHDSSPGFPGQDRWRRHMTDAATSQLCLDALSASPTSQEGGCNTCGLLFSPFPSNHFTGNSWTATCSYLQHLLPSSKLVPIRNNLLDHLTTLRHDFFPKAPPYYGTGRYMGEHWIGTSPLLRPCDLSKHPNIGYWLTTDHNTSVAFDEAKSAPRFSIRETDWAWQAAVKDPSILDKPYRRMRDYFLLPGVLQRFVEEYNAIPPDNWWGWSWYVDGARWKKRVKERGKQAVTAFLEEE